MVKPRVIKKKGELIFWFITFDYFLSNYLRGYAMRRSYDPPLVQQSSATSQFLTQKSRLD